MTSINYQQLALTQRTDFKKHQIICFFVQLPISCCSGAWYAWSLHTSNTSSLHRGSNASMNMKHGHMVGGAKKRRGEANSLQMRYDISEEIILSPQLLPNGFRCKWFDPYNIDIMKFSLILYHFQGSFWVWAQPMREGITYVMLSLISWVHTQNDPCMSPPLIQGWQLLPTGHNRTTSTFYTWSCIVGATTWRSQPTNDTNVMSSFICCNCQVFHITTSVN